MCSTTFIYAMSQTCQLYPNIPLSTLFGPWNLDTFKHCFFDPFKSSAHLRLPTFLSAQILNAQGAKNPKEFLTYMHVLYNGTAHVSHSLDLPKVLFPQYVDQPVSVYV